MDLLKLLPLLFVAAQGEARAIHQQLLPAIPGYVPVYIQEEPDVQVIYETGRKVAVHDSDNESKLVVEKPGDEPVPQKVAEEANEAAEENQSESEQPAKEQVKEEAPSEGKEPEKTSEGHKPESEEHKQESEEHKPESEEQNAIKTAEEHHHSSQESSSSTKTGSGSAVLVPGYQ